MPLAEKLILGGIAALGILGAIALAFTGVLA